ncbi:MAG: T9SS type A sorting domain-containing protein [Bacteroidetes bacterium]|nr:T9SS type A sorting domain-containing protein [Bacteroidota bacterium]
MKTKLFTIINLFIFLFILNVNCHAQTYFQKVYQSSPFDQEGQDILQMPDGGYLIAGYTTNSTVNDLDVHVIKTDAFGNTVWTKSYGGNKPDFPYHMIATLDGNYFLIGYSQSYGGGDWDILLWKIDPAGTLLWWKKYGGNGNDQARDIISTIDGNYMIVGWSNSSGAGGQDANLIKIDPIGAVIWSKTYGGVSDDFGCSIKQCSDGNFILLGQTFSYGSGNGDAYLIKTNSNGDTTWTKTIGEAQNDEGVYITVNNDNSFTFLIRDSCNVGMDIDTRVVKMDASGNILWSKTYGGTQKDTPKMIQPTSDGGYIVAATSRSFGWINPDMWILKLNSSGDTTWTRHYGGVNNEHCYVVREMPDGSYIAVGKTASYGPDVDPIFLKLNPSGTLAVGTNEYKLSNNRVEIYPNPAEEFITVDFKGCKARKITIKNIMGQEVYNKEINGEESLNIHLEDQPPGVYFVRGDMEKGSIITKFVLK